jgi:transcriptional regulator with XRE-family HTH domain
MVHMWGILIGLRLLAVSALVVGMVAVAPAAVAAGEESSAASLTEAAAQTVVEEDAHGLDVALAASDGRLSDPRLSTPPSAQRDAATEPTAETSGERAPEQSATTPPGETRAGPPSSAPGLAGPASAVNNAPGSKAPSEGSEPGGAIPADGGSPAAATDIPADSPGASHGGAPAASHQDPDEGQSSPAPSASGPGASPEEGRPEHPSGSPVSAGPPVPKSGPAFALDERPAIGTSQASTRAAPMAPTAPAASAPTTPPKPAPAPSTGRVAAAEPRPASAWDPIARFAQHCAPIATAPSAEVIADGSDATRVVAAGVIAAGPRVSTAVSVAMDFARLSGGWAGPIVFNVWLRRQMRERRMSQRQLAGLSGVDHSTISRLLAGGRSPSLDTAAKLVHALRLEWTEDQVATYFELLPERTLLPTQRVESALRGDPELDDPAVRTLMRQYLSIRQRRPKAGGGRPDRMARRGPPRGATSTTDQQSGP